MVWLFVVKLGKLVRSKQEEDEIMSKVQKRRESRIRRHTRVRKKVSGSSVRPRLAVFRSAKHCYVQAIDDEKGHTVASASTQDPEVKELLSGFTGNKDAAALTGKIVAERLLKKSISSVVFDRGGYIYHGRIQALAEGAREAGLQF